MEFAPTHRCNNMLNRVRLAAVLGLFALCTALMLAQPRHQTGATLQGMVTDAKGGGLAKVAVLVSHDADGKSLKATTDAEGHYTVSGLPAGAYTVNVTAPGFAPLTKKVSVTADQTTSLDLSLTLGTATSDVTVEADATHSIAASLAPMDALLSETSARTEISGSFIRNFTSPVSDYGEDVNYAPGTFTLNGNGVGLGQSKTYFRGFPDGDYDIDFDGIPFYDTNTPTHHSWAFFPSQALGGIDFDRSPGTASTIGPTPFGGSIHLLSRDMSPIQNIRATFSGGSFNTYLYDLAYDSGPLGPGHKINLDLDVHHIQSHGYQTLNNQAYNSGDIKVVYNINPKLTLTGFSEVIWVDANTPNFSATRCQMYGVSSTAYSCALAGTTTGLYPYTGAGINFLNTNNSDPELYLDEQYNYYHVPTDFEYVGVHKTLGKGFTFDIKPYTYNYDNSEKYTNVVPITDNAALIGTVYAPLGVKITQNTLCSTVVTTTKKGVSYSAEPCGVDKYNSYRKYGETSELDQVSKRGTLKAGFWYEWANTNRHQYPSDPLNHWADQTLPNFAEKFVTDSYQPFAEYQYHLTRKLDIDGGVKFAYYTIGTQQFADDGKTIGGLGTNNPASFIANGGSYFATLPSGSVSYRIKSNWSAYFQGATGSVVPPSSVFDYAQPNTAGSAFLAVNTLPKQQKNTTYQAGTVLKLKRVTFDADYYHIYFDNSYSSASNQASGGEPVFYAQPASVTQGVEGESNIYFGYGVSLYLNASYDSAAWPPTATAPRRPA
jgi:iron complex outermembrane receptor protein